MCVCVCVSILAHVMCKLHKWNTETRYLCGTTNTLSWTCVSFSLTSCWLSLDDGFIWSFLGPVCLIIFANVFFFIITVWKLAQKFTSLNPDLSKLHKIKSVSVLFCLCVLQSGFLCVVLLLQWLKWYDPHLFHCAISKRWSQLWELRNAWMERLWEKCGECFNSTDSPL